MNVRRWFVLFVLSLSRGFSQDPGYIEQIFKAQIGELPRMGWLAPERGFLTEQNAATAVYLFAPLGIPSTLQRNGYLTWDEFAPLRKQYGIACRIAKARKLAVFYAEVHAGPSRALYVSRRMRGEMRSGLVSIRLEGASMVAVNRLLGFPTQGVLRRDEAIGVRQPGFFYSLHRLYDAKSGALREEAIVLHRKDGEIVAHKGTRDIGADGWCDGCAFPNYLQADSGLYRPLNMFEVPGSAYPVPLLDASTHENETLSLLTFTPEGKIAQYSESEYVMHCR